MPSAMPSASPTAMPSAMPSVMPSGMPTATPTTMPSAMPSVSPTTMPSAMPSVSPTGMPTWAPSVMPSAMPSVAPSAMPSAMPTTMPSATPSDEPSTMPSDMPSFSCATLLADVLAVPQCPTAFGNDYCALFDLFDATDGCSWDSYSGWLSSTDVCDFEGVTCEVIFGSPEVTEVNLSGYNLVGSIPTTLFYLPQLTVLDLSDNSLAGDIPTQLGLLVNLESFDISTNAYDNPTNGDGVMPAEVCDLRSGDLTYLAADCNAAEVELVDCNVAVNCCTDCTNVSPSDSPSAVPVATTDEPTADPSGAPSLAPSVAVTTLVPSAPPSCDSTLNYDCSTSDNVSECEALVAFYENMGGCAWTNGSAGSRRLAEVGARNLAGRRSWGSSDTCEVGGLAAPEHCCWFGSTCDCSDSSLGCVVKKLELVGNNLDGVIPDSIGDLTYVAVIEFSYNKVNGVLTSALATLEFLEVFMVDNNEVTGSAEFMCSKDGVPLNFFSSDCDDFVEVTACSCCFCTIQLGPSESPSVTASDAPSLAPSVSDAPTVTESVSPTDMPSASPSDPVPSDTPSDVPSDVPSATPSICEDAFDGGYVCTSTDTENFPGVPVTCDLVVHNANICNITSCKLDLPPPSEACCECKGY